MNTSLPYVMRDQVTGQVNDIMNSRPIDAYQRRTHSLVEAGLFTLFVTCYLLALALNA